ncbi:hypothetical protein [Luteolibacter sp. Populi]|uniref:hypothetical protein n=1 Tax=Luteolibacter sp. Populi TaxID=3230487 RepID=UPI003467B1FA
MLPPDPGAQSEAERHFIELATRPLENAPAVRDEARGELMERLSRQPPHEREAAATEAAARLAKTVPGSWRGKAMAAAAAWLLLTGILVSIGFSFFHEADTADEEWTNALAQSFEETDMAKAAEDPASYEKAIQRLFSSHDYDTHHDPGVELPADYREVWTRIDPGNGAWALREALARSGWSTAPNPVQEFAGVWALVEEAARAPRFEIYAPEALLARLQRHPEPGSYLELGMRSGGRQPLLNRSWNLREGVVGIFQERGRLMVVAGDKDGLRSAIRDWERLCAKLAAECLSLSDMNYAGDLVAAGNALLLSADDLKMKEEEQHVRTCLNAIPHESSEYSYSPGAAAIIPAMGMSAREIFHYGPPNETAAYEAGRMGEYACIERILAPVVAIPVLLVLALVWIESLRRGRRVNGLAAGLAPLFDGRDAFWLVGLGVLVPFAWYWGITRLTPLGCREAALFHHGYTPLVMQAAAGLLLLLVMIVQTGQWRIARRCSAIGLGARHLWPGWGVVAFTAALLPASGIGRWLPHSQIGEFLLITCASAGIPLLWLLWRAAVLVFGPGSNSLAGVLLSRAMTPPLILATALLLAAYPVMLGVERNWLAQDQITGWDRSRATTKQESRSVDALLARFREIFGQPAVAPPAR